MDQLKLKVSQLEEECTLLRRARGPLPGAEEKEREPDSADLVSELRAENQRLTASLQELQDGRQQVRGVALGGRNRGRHSCCSLILLRPENEDSVPGSEDWVEPWPASCLALGIGRVLSARLSLGLSLEFLNSLKLCT